MERRLLILERRRSLLIERAEVQRQAMAAAVAGLERPLHWLDAGMSFANSVRPASGLTSLSSLLGAFLSMSTRLTRTRAWVARGLMLLQVVKFVRSRFEAHVAH